MNILILNVSKYLKTWNIYQVDKVILDLNQRAYVGHQNFRVLNLLPVHKRVKQIILCHVFKIKHKIAPAYIDYHLVSHDTVHSYSTNYGILHLQTFQILTSFDQSFKVAAKSHFIKGLIF